MLKTAAGMSGFALTSQTSLAGKGEPNRLLPDIKVRNTTEEAHTFQIKAQLTDGVPQTVFSETVELDPGKTKTSPRVFSTPATSEVSVTLDGEETVTRDASAVTALPRIYGLDAAVKPELFAVYKRHVDVPEVTA
ncbi:hypothetical protein M0R88_14960 [Halorussus gelatinilyticus]|uniref:Ig-like domain-containing protein n=1 Tax=Halorussus gelatinilyticus TaxID=2937524 RepID=A0A8U0IFF4_9EURY|nr:hypothetical protein [Halorussus gelatinilyticus]UPV99806.1 hypothetical protein M0R88_14960 [Halorussus gelatinilyticus]